MMLPANTGWSEGAPVLDQIPAPAAIDSEPLVVMDGGALLLPLIGIAALMAAAVYMESAKHDSDFDEIDEIETDDFDDDDFDDDEDEEDDLDDEEEDDDDDDEDEE